MNSFDVFVIKGFTVEKIYENYPYPPPFPKQLPTQAFLGSKI